MQVFRVCCRSAEAAVEVTDKCLKPGIRVITAGNVLQTHLLNEPVLKRQIGAFEAAFGLGAVGTDKVDVQVVQSASELYHAGAACFGLADAEYCVLIAVKRHRLAVLVDVIARGHHVIKSRFTLAEAQVHQTAGRIIDVNQQTAFWCAAFEPVMVRAVDLDKFAKTIPPLTWLIYPGLTASVRDPESVSSHPASQRLNGDSDPVTLLELFCGKCGSETDVIFHVATSVSGIAAHHQSGECRVYRGARSSARQHRIRDSGS